MEIKPEQYFYASNGAVLKSLEDLRDLLAGVDDSTFMHHCNSEKNDFSNWTKDVLKEKGLASKMAKKSDKESIFKLVDDRLGAIEKKKAKEASKKKVIDQIKGAHE